MKKYHGVLTVEAALILPMVLFTFLTAMRSGITLFTETKELTEKLQEQTETDAPELFRRIQWLGEEWKDGD